MAITHYGIKFPFNIKSIEKTFLDLDTTPPDAIKSAIMHLIFTPKGQKIRDPEFGTNLIQFIFNPNDTQTWGEVKSDIKEAVSKFVPNASLDDIEIYEVDDGRGLVADIKYSVKDSTFNNTYQLITKL